MKVKVISRNPDEYLRETKRDIHKGERGIAIKIFTYVVTILLSQLLPFICLHMQFPATMTRVCTPSRQPGSTCRR